MVTAFVPAMSFASDKDNTSTKALASDEPGTKSIVLPSPVKVWVLERIAENIFDSIFSKVFDVIVGFLERSSKLFGGSGTTVIKINGHEFNPDSSANWVGNGLANKRIRVIDLQTSLKKLRFNPGSIDGYWGRNTRSALINVQRWYGISVDGSCGPRTWRTLSAPLS
ncbi:peptidoglycan-binding protein [Clostridium sp. D2Q-14]|uniref:peptidoglycan-binding domain-containing protein n=1 Tax=Anaeromonas gelatinilytica TaxID=2683194 RepID=UPI00193B6682|nr:peptidoglycan-binding domain-containing protein [Anaeromonas gelatinilytica]MBS4534635.1 peptidoglycan-binding protein [Anaeromonas gelatinilytica]